MAATQVDVIVRSSAGRTAGWTFGPGRAILEAPLMLKSFIVAAAILVAPPAFAQIPLNTVPAHTAGDVSSSSSLESQVETTPTFASLFGDLGRDFRRLPSRETALILGSGGVLGLAVRHEDHDLTRRAVASHPLDEALDAGAVVGGGYIQFGLAFGTYALGRAEHSPRVSHLGADLVRAQLVNTLLTQGIKVAVRRERPDGGNYSFPSGHTSSAFATATVLQRHLGWKVGVPAYAVAAYVAGNRLPENKHFMSDVLFGAAVGIASGRTVTVGQGRARFAMSPLAAPGGGGIGFTLLGER